MNPFTSAFLDILRICSAAVVFLSHCAQHWNQEASTRIQPLAHCAVIIFFVLSGFVIANSTLSKGKVRSLRDYLVARLSRLYSVVIPAILLTITLQFVGSALAPTAYESVSRGADAIRYLMSALYIQSIWFLSAAPPTNGPLWSLSYEAWYYVGFGVITLTQSRKAAAALAAGVLLIAGPNILLLAPAWAIGVGLYIVKSRHESARLQPAPIITAGIAVLLLSTLFATNLPYKLGKPPMYFSASFFSDWVFSLGVALLIGGIDSVRVKLPTHLLKNLRKAGDYTFPFYLYHFPIIFFFTATTGFRAETFAQGLTAATAVFACVLLFSWCTERWRPLWQATIQLILKHTLSRA